MFGHDKDGEKWGFWKFERRAEEAEPTEERLAEAERWEEAMNEDDMPEFAGEWGYGPQGEEGKQDLAEEKEDEGDEIADARKLVNYGFDTASRMYGLEAVIDTIVKTDEMADGAENPLGAVYQALVPDVEERKYLYLEIRKDNERDSQYNNPEAGKEREFLGFTQEGDFYDKTEKQAGKRQKSVEAIRAVRRLMNVLETDERFDGLREKAYQKDQTLIGCLMETTDKPTVSQFLDSIMTLEGGEVSDEKVDEVLEEIENAEDVGDAGDVEGSEVVEEE